MRAWLAGAWKRATDLAGTRRGALVLVLAALVVFAVQSLGWPVAPGRDLSAYLIVYVDFWNGDPVLPWTMVNRTPVAPLVVGGILDLGNPAVVVAIAVAWRRPRHWWATLTPVLAGLAMLLATVMAVWAEPAYAVPVVPAFVLLAAVGLLGEKRERSDGAASTTSNATSTPFRSSR